jgi:hypothetical protein
MSSYSTAACVPTTPATFPGANDRAYWVHTLHKVASPVLRALAAGNLKVTMPVEGTGDSRYDRKHFSHLEALARTLVGVAPWLELDSSKITSPEEAKQQAELSELARQAISQAVDPASPDFVNFSFSYQPIVDAAFLCHAILRAPTELWTKLPPHTQTALVAALQATRSRKPHYNNWLLFAAMIETGLAKMGAEWDHMRVDYALRQHETWYKGDGIYGDGPELHNDYYNSLVIQPMLVDILRAVGDTYPEWNALRKGVYKRAVRYGEVQERTISPEGTFPPLGRSLSYRCGAMQHLAQMALQETLGSGLTPEQVRGALGSVIHRSLDAPGTFDSDGWLTVGFAGHQLEVGEMYISTGSLYLATTAFLPLGLPPSHAFWSGADRDWTSKRMWSGGSAPIDHALDHVAI